MHLEVAQETRQLSEAELALRMDLKLRALGLAVVVEKKTSFPFHLAKGR